MKKVNERKEALFRIVVLLVSGLIIGIWKGLVQILVIANFIYTLIRKKRHKDMAELCEWWNTEAYKFMRYISFVSNVRPFPFSKAEKMSKFR